MTLNTNCLMKSKFLLGALSICAMVAISFHVFGNVFFPYTISVQGDPGGINCIPDLNIEFYGQGKISESDHFNEIINPYNPTFGFPSNLHNITVNGVMLDEVGGIHSSTSSVICFCCDNCEYYCAYITIDENTNTILFDVVNDPNLSCQGPGCPPDPQ